jgi:hypothetical protein
MIPWMTRYTANTADFVAACIHAASLIEHDNPNAEEEDTQAWWRQGPRMCDGFEVGVIRVWYM